MSCNIKNRKLFSVSTILELLARRTECLEPYNSGLGTVVEFRDLIVTRELHFPSLPPIIANALNSKQVYGKSVLYRFHNCVFEQKLNLRDDEVAIEFIDCCFNELRIKDRITDLALRSCSEIKHLNLFETRIGSKENRTKFVIHESKIVSVNFSKSKFFGLADFWNSTFYEPTTFYKTDFNATAVFSMATFEKNVLFTYSLLAGKSIFAKTDFKAGLDLSQAIISGELKLFDIQFDNEEFETEYFQREQKGEYQNAIDNRGVIPTDNKVHTFQILRKAYEDVGNYDDATRMRRAEKVATKELVKSRLNLAYKPITGFENILHFDEYLRSLFQPYCELPITLNNDRVILWLNKFSNNYRTSFWRGVGFTASMAIVFGFLTLVFTAKFDSHFCFGCEFDAKAFAKGLKFFFNFLNPARRINYLDGFDPKFYGISYLFDFLGRIAVGYGIYQTVQAFRKFK